MGGRKRQEEGGGRRRAGPRDLFFEKLLPFEKWEPRRTVDCSFHFVLK